LYYFNETRCIDNTQAQKDPMQFTPYHDLNSKPENESYVIITRNRELLALRDKAQYYLPKWKDFDAAQLDLRQCHYIGTIGTTSCFACNDKAPQAYGNKFSVLNFRDLFDNMESQSFEAALYGYHISSWDRNSGYCCRCGSTVSYMAHERGKKCLQCGFTQYPVISPCIIVAVVKDESHILLARAQRFDTAFYSVIAGYVETGETLEHCVAREVAEETGIKVKNIHYFGNQPWPFSQSLMIAFTAQYAGGEIVVDGTEIVDANWYTVDKLPRIPSPISISRKLIDWFIEKNTKTL